MKRNIAIISALVVFLTNINVFACGEIKNIKIDGKSIPSSAKKNEEGTIYEITITDKQTKVRIDAEANGEWEEGFAPREVSTNNSARLKVNGHTCGTGITTYEFRFVKEKKQTETTKTETPKEETTKTTTPVEETPKVQEQTPSEVEETVDKTPYLKNIVIEGYELNFDAKTTGYKLEVENDVTSIKITTETEKTTDAVVISENANKLEVGENVVTISLVTASGEANSYKITVNRKELLSSNNFLSSVEIGEYPFNFDPGQMNYTLEIGKVKTLEIEVQTQDEKATYEITGNNDLKNNSVINIIVTAEDGTTKTYSITIDKKMNILDTAIELILDNAVYFILGGVLVLLLLILLISNGLKKKKKKKIEPDEIQATETTVGEIAAPVVAKEETQPQPLSTPNQEQTPTTIEFISPTNVENNKEKVDEEKSTTEVFKL